MRCMACDKTLTDLRGVGYEITGVERPREQGGTNHVLNRQRTGRVMCPGCVTSLLYGKPVPGQLSLTDA